MVDGGDPLKFWVKPTQTAPLEQNSRFSTDIRS